MVEIKFVHLSEIDQEQMINLMNNPLVGKQLPLLGDGFSTEDYHDFLKSKKQLWDDHGFGPWAFMIKGIFAGWGGLQHDQGDLDFALVLHPNFWGWGRKIFEKIKDQAFNKMNINSITILLPPSRKNSKAVTRFGFNEDGEKTVQGMRFVKFRLAKP